MGLELKYELEVGGITIEGRFEIDDRGRVDCFYLPDWTRVEVPMDRTFLQLYIVADQETLLKEMILRHLSTLSMRNYIDECRDVEALNPSI